MICEKCLKERKRYLKGRDICQACYRAELSNYSYLDYKTDIRKLSEKKQAVCKMAVEEGKDSKTIAKAVGYNVQIVRKIIHDNLKRVDVDGNEIQ